MVEDVTRPVTFVELVKLQQKLGSITREACIVGMISNELSDARGKIKKFEAAQKPRPMSEAPRDGTRILSWKGIWNIVSWDDSESRWRDDDGEWILCDSWIPCPPDPCCMCDGAGWVVGVEGASAVYGMGGSNECQVDCPRCSRKKLDGD